GAQVRLVEIPAERVARRRGAERQAVGNVIEQAEPLADAARQRGHPAEQRSRPHGAEDSLAARGRRRARSSRSAIVRAMLPHRLPASALCATLIALVTACALDRPCALMNGCVKPSSGAPPYCCQSVIDLSWSIADDSAISPSRHARRSLWA